MKKIQGILSNPYRNFSSWKNKFQFNEVNDKTIATFENLLGKDEISVDPEILQAHNTDWTKILQGSSKLLLTPKTHDGLQEIVKICYKNHWPLITQGGRTSLVGGATPYQDEIMLSTHKLNKIYHFNENMNTISCDAGVIMQNANEFLQNYGFELPYDLGAKGTCTIGGNVATNAAGTQFIRFGQLRGYVLGLEFIDGKGDKLSLLKEIRKDNTGPDIKQILIGSEGLLGIMTKVNILCPAIPLLKKSYYVKANSFSEILDISSKFREIFGLQVCSIEYMDDFCVECFEKRNSSIKIPVSNKKGSQHLLLQWFGNQEMPNIESEFLEAITNMNIEIIASQNQQQEDLFWEIRHGLSDSLTFYDVSKTKALKFDISIPIPYFCQIKEDVRQFNFHEIVNIGGFGHLGDGNLHLNVVVDKEMTPLRQTELREKILNKVIEIGGSISAEHGIGHTKAKFFSKIKGPQVEAYYRQCKKIFDPHMILNPMKMFLYQICLLKAGEVNPTTIKILENQLKRLQYII